MFDQDLWATDFQALILFSVGICICFFSYKCSEFIIIASGVALASLFIWNELVAQIEGDRFLQYVMCYVITLVGAMVGGVFALLMTWLSSGIILGTQIALWAILADKGHFISGSMELRYVFSVCIALSTALSWYKEQVFTVAAFCHFGALLISAGYAILSNGSLVSNIFAILNLQWPTDMKFGAQSGMWTSLILWASLGFIAFFIQSHFSGTFSVYTSLRNLFLGYQNIPSSASDNTIHRKRVQQKTFTYPVDQAYNYFSPEHLPPALQLYAPATYITAEQIANFFGFQDDNARNQVEHILYLVGNHGRFCDGDEVYKYTPISGVHSIHKKLFENYREWCQNLDIQPRFTHDRKYRASADFSFGSIYETDILAHMTDIVLYMCIWGEAANLRHMPECICYIYHKMIHEFSAYNGNEDQPALYAGFFLDHVVTPIWEVVSERQKVNGYHTKAQNYDDFNEFFWSPVCLKYSYRDIESSSLYLQLGASNESENKRMPKVVPVHRVLANTPKSFLEKRSILSPMLAFNRIFEFHLVTFYLCSVAAFSELLVWEQLYTLKIISSVFLFTNILSIIWCMLEVWQAFPGINISGTARVGFLLRLSMRFILLVYQSLFFIWSIEGENHNLGANMEGSPSYWWWQYIWISCITFLPHAISSIFQIIPWLTTLIFTRDNDFFNAALNICIPFTRLQEGKRVHESIKNVLLYALFWLTLLLWKIYFSYQYEVKILIIPTIETYDDYINFVDQRNFILTASLIIARWLPQAFIYLIDTSIWFACWSTVVGGIIGFQDRLGEIRDFVALREVFVKIPQEFCKKIIFEKVTSRGANFAYSSTSLGSNVNASISERRNLSLRPAGRRETTRLLEPSNGLVPEYDSNPKFLEVRMQKWAAFAAAWNEIINQMRRTDILSNTERDMLKFHSFVGFKKQVYLPIFQTAGSFEKAIHIVINEATAYKMHGEMGRIMAFKQEKHMKASISQDLTVAEAVGEVWELGKWLIRHLMGELHEAEIMRMDKIISKWIFKGEILLNISLENLNSAVKDFIEIITVLHTSLSRRTPRKNTELPPPPKICEGGLVASRIVGSVGMKRGTSVNSLQSLQNGDTPMLGSPASFRRGNLRPRDSTSSIPDKTRDQIRQNLRPLFDTLSRMLRVSVGDSGVIQDLLHMIVSLEQGFFWSDAYATSCIDELATNSMAQSIISKLYGLLVVQASEAEPISTEAKRRLTFFVNSLFMDMPMAPPIHRMLSWSCITPYYSEDVLYSRKELETRNEDGLNTLIYLQALHKHDWHNFIERLGVKDEQHIWSKRYFQELRMWSSMRAQTLFRTVEGMMYYEAAIRLLAHIERYSVEQVDSIVKTKFQYVVSCQVYGRMKKIQDPKADDIEILLKRFPNLRVAYIDEVRVTREGLNEYYSVLIKATEDGQGISEVYRIKLPGNPIIGEGKPENQNLALIYTRGENVQAIDMNQEAYFEEALKMRCLLQEFQTDQDPPRTIVGFREHIFTGSVSSLANYMALQEFSFVTIGQRVLDRPLCIRMHYGHPDLFDKLFFLTRGGMSKASRGINLSEDIFAGYKNVLRGGQVVFREYTQVGKGRDVGMQQIYKFEAKLSQGAAEQCMSRDINRIGARLDFFRLFSFYFGGLGYYIGNFVTILTIVFVVYFMLALAVFELEEIGERAMIPEGTLQMLLAGMGILNTLPMLGTLTTEKGLIDALVTVGNVFISGGPMYFMFHIQTRAHYFYQTLFVGGAQYRATGRGFVTHHSRFDNLYRSFAVSHFYLGIELVVALIIMAFTTQAPMYIGRTWSLWIASLSFLFAPFWFNPLAFEWGKVVKDYKNWLKWMGGSGGTSSNSWEIWWREENVYMSKLSPSQKLQCIIKPFIHLVIGFGIALPKYPNISGLSTSELLSIAKAVGMAALLLLAYCIINYFGRRFSPWIQRSGKLAIFFVVVINGVALVVTQYSYIRLAIGLYYMVASFCSIFVLLGFTSLRHAYYIYDFMLGNILFIALFFMAALQLPKNIQTWLLYHNALSQGVIIEDILKYARRTQDQSTGSENFDESMELKNLIKHQDYMIRQLVTLSKRQYDEGVEVEHPVTAASMMHASQSTLDFSKLAGISDLDKQEKMQI